MAIRQVGSTFISSEAYPRDFISAALQEDKINKAAILRSMKLHGYDSEFPIDLIRRGGGEGRLKVLDGFHRQTCAQELSIPATYREIQGDDEDLRNYVLLRNVLQKNQSATTKVKLFLCLYPKASNSVIKERLSVNSSTISKARGAAIVSGSRKAALNKPTTVRTKKRKITLPKDMQDSLPILAEQMGITIEELTEKAFRLLLDVWRDQGHIGN